MFTAQRQKKSTGIKSLSINFLDVAEYITLETGIFSFLHIAYTVFSAAVGYACTASANGGLQAPLASKFFFPFSVSDKYVVLNIPPVNKHYSNNSKQISDSESFKYTGKSFDNKITKCYNNKMLTG